MSNTALEATRSLAIGKLPAGVGSSKVFDVRLALGQRNLPIGITVRVSKLGRLPTN